MSRKEKTQKKDYALISVVGDRDPIPLNPNNKYDGSLLHILRYYKPKVIQLIFTNDRKNFLDETNWIEDLKVLMKKQWNYEPIFLEPSLLETDAPHLMKNIDKDLHRYTRDFLNNYAEEFECLVNISSGTPAMKTIAEMETISNDILGVQVSAPASSWKGNRKNQDVTLDLNEYFSNSEEDNSQEKNRCETADLSFIDDENKINIIGDMLNNYNYASLLDLLKDPKYKNLLYPLRQLLSLLKAKKEFNDVKIEEEFNRVNKNQTLDIKFPLASNAYLINSEEAEMENDLIEYFLILKILERTNEYTDFIIHLNPFLVTLTQFLIQKFLNFILDNDTDYFFEKDGKTYLSKRKIDQDMPGLLEHYEEIKAGRPIKVTDRKVKRGSYDESFYFNLDIGTEIIRYLYDQYSEQFPELFDLKIKKNIGNFFINLNEQNSLRNTLAHSLRRYNEQDKEFKKRVKYKPSEIIKNLDIILEKYLEYYSPDYINFYDNANNYIMNRLKERE